MSGLPGQPIGEDAAARRLEAGTLLNYDDVLVLRELIPKEVWAHRDQFFHDGMRMLIGPCHRRYGVPEFYQRATEEFAGRARIDSRNNLDDYVAGLPFPPDQIDPKAPDAGARWAWNVEHRYRGGGPNGPFRIVDLPSTRGSVQHFSGDFFFIQTRHRADLPESGYAIPDTPDALFIAGGRFQEPFNARHLAWRQIRPLKAVQRYEEPDDTFVYVPTARKVRRSATAWVDGMFTPRYRVSGATGGSGLGIPDPYGAAGGGDINPGTAESMHVTENLRRGFVGLAFRPNAYVWKVEGEREVIAPINGAHSDDGDRNFGPSGLSVGADRWDVRWAVVLGGAARERNGAFQWIRLYVDYQTAQPLFYVTRRARGNLVDVGVLVHRYSGDIPGYPDWAEGKRALVFDPVLASFYSVQDGSGWRRESYRITSTPLAPAKIRRYTTSMFLAAGR